VSCLSRPQALQLSWDVRAVAGFVVKLPSLDRSVGWTTMTVSDTVDSTYAFRVVGAADDVSACSFPVSYNVLCSRT
jgi:hypothetical protein